MHKRRAISFSKTCTDWIWRAKYTLKSWSASIFCVFQAPFCSGDNCGLEISDAGLEGSMDVMRKGSLIHKNRSVKWKLPKPAKRHYYNSIFFALFQMERCFNA